MKVLATKAKEGYEVQLSGDSLIYVIYVSSGTTTLFIAYDLRVSVVDELFKAKTKKQTHENIIDYVHEGIINNYNTPSKWLSAGAIDEVICSGGSTMVNNQIGTLLTGSLSKLGEAMDNSQGSTLAIFLGLGGEWNSIWDRIEMTKTLKALT